MGGAPGPIPASAAAVRLRTHDHRQARVSDEGVASEPVEERAGARGGPRSRTRARARSLVQVGAAGACHSDLHLMHEFEPGMLPWTTRRSPSATRTPAGCTRSAPGVTGLEVGQPVAVVGAWGCGTCAHCRAGPGDLLRATRPRARARRRWRAGPRRRHGRLPAGPGRPPPRPAPRRPRSGRRRAADRRGADAVPRRAPLAAASSARLAPPS